MNFKAGILVMLVGIAMMISAISPSVAAAHCFDTNNNCVGDCVQNSFNEAPWYIQWSCAGMCTAFVATAIGGAIAVPALVGCSVCLGANGAYCYSDCRDDNCWCLHC